MPRTLTVEQGYQMVNAMYAQMTGEAAIAVVDESTFGVVASSMIKLGYNQICNALVEMFNSIKVDNRPYSAQYRLVWNTAEQYGAHQMSISFFDNGVSESDPAWTIKDGDTIGSHKVKLPKTYEMDITGTNVIHAHITITKNQLKTAFRSGAELAKFFSGLLQNIEDQLEQQKEGISRSCLLGYMAGLYSYHAAAGNLKYMQNATVHLLTEYNAKFTKTYESMAALQAVPADYSQFWKFVVARMNYITKLLGNRDKFFHVNPYDDPKCAAYPSQDIMRHSRPEDLRCYVCDTYLEDARTQVYSEVHHTDALKMVPHESVLFWQSPASPESLNVKTKKMLTNGNSEDVPGVQLNNVFAVLYDKDALGVGVVDESEYETPYDGEREAQNKGWKLHVQSWKNYTNKGVLFLMD